MSALEEREKRRKRLKKNEQDKKDIERCHRQFGKYIEPGHAKDFLAEITRKPIPFQRG